MLCPHCGAEIGPARSCPSCGTRIHAEDPVRGGRHVGPGGRHTLVAPIVLAGAAVGLVIVLLVVVVVMLSEDRERVDSEVATRGGSTPTAASSPSPAPETPSDGPVTPTVEPAEQPSATPTTETPDVGTLPAGLFCRDLDAQGYAYAAAVEYWRLHGQPSRMDADSNGVPCETVYSEQDVQAFWSP